MEEGSPTDQVTVIEVDGSGEDFCAGAQQGALSATLTLDPSTANITAPKPKGHNSEELELDSWIFFLL